MLVLFVAAPLVAILWPEATPPEEAPGCMDVLGFGAGNSVPDFTSRFVAAGVALVGLVFLVSCFFVCHRDDETVAS
jgi:hypothetical protein